MSTLINKLLCPGRTDVGNLFIEVNVKDGRLSISGVEGPMGNGNCKGGCGQVRDALNQLTRFHKGWTPELVAQLKAVWERWHLNDMRAGCEHQRAEGWADRPIDPSKPTNTYGKHFPGQEGDSWNMLTWVTPKEHPDGLLTKPCDVCGYKYGTAWLREELPDDVLTFLTSLPETELSYPWRRT